MESRELRVVLTMDDFDRGVAFFRDTLGLKQVAAWQNDGGNAMLLDAGHATLELFDETQALAIDKIEVGHRVAGKVRLAFRTADCESIASDLAMVGGEILGGPLVTPWGDRNIRMTGPEGIQLTLFTPPNEA